VVPTSAAASPECLSDRGRSASRIATPQAPTGGVRSVPRTGRASAMPVQGLPGQGKGGLPQRLVLRRVGVDVHRYVISSRLPPHHQGCLADLLAHSASRGPSEGQRWIYFRAPWGMQFELVSYPGGKAFARDPTAFA
jgi:hypothetical protein